MPSVVCAEVGVTPTTLAKWRKDNRWGEEGGAPLARRGTSKFGDTWWYDKAGVKAWAAVNRGEGVGGKREGAGRPRKETKRRRDEETTGAQGGPDSGRSPEPPRLPLQVAADQASAEAAIAEQKRMVDPLELVKLAKTDVTRVEVQNRKDLISAGKAAVELQERLGEMVARKDVRAALAEALSRCRQRLDGAGPRIADRVMALLGVDVSMRAAVLAAVKAEIGVVRDELRDPL